MARFKERHSELKTTKADVIRDKIIIEKRDEGLSGQKISDYLAKDYGYQLDKSNVNKIIKRYDLNKATVEI